MEESEQEIKTMKLYYHVDRIFNELQEMGYKPDDSLKVEDVCKFDQYHYHGVETVEQVVNSFKLHESSKVLDVGSGIGGPARYIAHRSGCQVTALELQKDLDETGAQLTARCGLDGKVSHVCGDILDIDLGAGLYDLIVSWLVFLHIPEKNRLYKQCFDHLKPGGQLYIEDFFSLGEFTEKEKQDLDEALFCKDLQSERSYVESLEEAGFINVKFENVTSSWAAFVNTRLKEFRSQKERHIRVHGQAIYEALEYFYGKVSEVFAGGNLGGVIVSASRPE